MSKFKFLFIFQLILASCATNKLQVKLSENEKNHISKSQIDHTFYLIGDAGLFSKDSLPDNLSAFKEELSKAKNNSTAIFLGDNIYPKGLPKKDDKGRKEAESILNNQINTVSNFKGKTIFIPGNHDWYSEGVKGLKRQEEYIEEALGKNTFLPEKGCPIETLKIGKDIVLIIIDSEWYLTDWDKHPTINDNCDIKTRARFFEEVEDEIKKATGKTTIIATHHPMYSNGPHGGNYSFASHLKPIPIIGSIKNLVRKTSGFSLADMQNTHYNELRKRLITLAQQNDKSIFISGHEHSLQYIVQDHIPQIISGSGSKTTATKNRLGGQFSYGSLGYAKLNIYKDGSSSVSFVSSEENNEVFTTTVFETDKTNQALNLEENFSSLKKASIYTTEETISSNVHTFLWGERFRKEYSTQIEANTVNLDTLYGGLKPIKKGGGHQSKSLRLEDANGTQYVMRALRKQAIQYLQTTFFADQYIDGKFENTATEGLILDVFAGSHPYAPFVIGDLADAIGVYHTNPRLFYVPKQNALGGFNSEFGDELYMIEEHTSEGHNDKASFGFSNKLISTNDLFEKIEEDESIHIDEASYIKARLFDMLIGDWDRHHDQWRWIEFKENGESIYRPMPRDRDQAFSKMSDGFILSTAVALIPNARLLRKYKVDLKDVKGFNIEPYPLDMAFIKNATKEDWDKQAAVIQKGITEQVIEKAFLNMPVEVRNGNVETIKTILRERLKNLPEISDRYYKFVNKFGVITGTNKDDAFIITANDDGTVLAEAFRKKDKGLTDKFHSKIYDPELTKEVWIYGLDDEDSFVVKGKSKQIKIRLIGGQNNDDYTTDYGRNVVIYDYKTKNNSVENAKKATIKLTDDYETNVYDYKKIKTNTNQLIPTFGFNPDDGFKIGASNTFTAYGFERNPFTSKHAVKAEYFFATEGFDFGYNGEFSNVIKKWNLNVDARITSDNFAQNFFGFGNSTPNFESAENDGIDADLDFNRVKQQYAHVIPSFIWRGYNGAEFKIGAGYESVKVTRTSGRFLETVFEADDPVFSDQEFLVVSSSYHYKNQNNKTYPTLGMEAGLTANFKDNINNSNSFASIQPLLAFQHKISANEKLVLATKFKGRITIGDDFEFYQAGSIGANNGLRGYRNERFTGKHYFYQNTDLRYSFNSIKTSILPISIGVYGGFDYGRVWINNELVTDTSFNDSKWNTSYGGGFWIDAVELLSARFGLFNSDDGLRFSFGLGFDF